MSAYLPIRKGTATMLLSFTLILWAACPETVYAYTAPRTNFEHIDIGSAPQEGSSQQQSNRCITSDLFYIEYPSNFSFGTIDERPLAFYNSDNQKPASDNEFHTFQDSNLMGSDDEVANYVLSGGINKYLKDVLKTEITADYHYSALQRSDGILMFSLDSGGNNAATIVIWTSFGQLSIRNETRTAKIDWSGDYGKIMIFPFDDSVDFSSAEAIKAFAFSDEPPYITDETDQQFTYRTRHHEYLCCEGETEDSKVALYYPVTPAGKKKWMVAFEVSKKSQVSDNAFARREEIIGSFQALK